MDAALATVPHLNEIFTTNWDDFFERECDATPIVTGDDYGIFQDIPGRKVFKLHGSISNYGSIVATEDDYRHSYHRLVTGTIGSKLKTLMSSKTILFIGFSFEDEDFRKVYRFVSSDLGGIMPVSYAVTLDENAEATLRSLGIDAIPIVTDATYFVSVLKARLVKDKFMISDEKYEKLPGWILTVRKEYARLSELNLLQHPDKIYSQFYQDGLLHAFEHPLSSRRSGVYSHFPRIQNHIRSYDILVRRKLHEGNYPDVAYFTGYLDGLTTFLVGNPPRDSLPMFYLFGHGEFSGFRNYLRLERQAPASHKAAHKLAVALAEAVGSDLLHIHHLPFLT